jgi:hypothetical protein
MVIGKENVAADFSLRWIEVQGFLIVYFISREEPLSGITKVAQASRLCSNAGRHRPPQIKVFLIGGQSPPT